MPWFIPILVIGSAVAALPCQQFRFALVRDVLDQKPTWTPAEPAAGDLDGDGSLDVVFAGPRPFYRRGNRFEAGAGFPAPPFPGNGRVVLLDSDGDGDLDVVQPSPSLRLYRNDGGGVLVDVTASRMPATISAGGAAVADIEGDGDPDLLRPFGRVFVNDGTGVFSDQTATRILATGPASGASIVAQDFDGDGDVDFINMAGLHRNDGSGHFTIDAAAGAALGYVDSAFAADVDGDADVDVITSSGGLLCNGGTGLFTAGADVLPPPTVHPWRVVAVADFDGDAVPDIAAAPTTPMPGEHPQWLRNDGQGTFLVDPSRGLPIGRDLTDELLVADLDGDGDRDLVATHMMSSVPAPAVVMTNDGTGHWQALAEFGDVATWRDYGRFAADLDGDGDQDVVQNGGVQRNDGRGVLRSQPIALPYGTPTQVLAAADVDGDGDLDLIGARTILRNDGNLQFTIAAALVGANEDIAAVAVLDLEGDQDLDLVITAAAYSATLTLRVLRNDGSGQFTAITTSGLQANDVVSLAAADFDGDGDQDVLTGQYSAFGPLPQPLRWHANDGTGTFTQQPLPATTWWARKLQVADYDGDGRLDVMFESLYQTVFFRQLPNQQFTTTTMASLAGTIPSPDDVDGDGDLDLWVRGVAGAWLRLDINDGTNAFVPTASRVDAQHPGTLPAVELVLIDLDGDHDRDVLVVVENVGAQSQAQLPLWNHRHQLRAPHRTRVGVSLDLYVSAIEVVPAPVAAAVAVSLATVRVPLGDLGVLGIDLASGVLLPPAVPPVGGGTVLVQLPIPAQASVLGIPLFAQALYLAPGELQLSGTVRTVIDM